MYLGFGCQRRLSGEFVAVKTELYQTKNPEDFGIFCLI